VSFRGRQLHFFAHVVQADFKQIITDSLVHHLDHHFIGEDLEGAQYHVA